MTQTSTTSPPNQAPVSALRKAFAYGVASALGFGLFFLLMTRTLPRAIALHNPEMALRFSDDPVALLAVAEKAYDEARGALGPDEGDPPQAGDRLRTLNQQFARLIPDQNSGRLPLSVTSKLKAQVEKSLRAEPLQAPALRLLGQLYAEEGDEEKAAKFMKAALALSSRETKAAYWLLRRAYEAQDFREAAQLCDLMLRTRYVGVPDLVIPVLARILENERGRPYVIELLSATPPPPWHSKFLGSLPAFIKNARTPLELMIALKDKPAAPTAEHISSYMDLLIQNRFFDLAYYMWLQQMTAAQLENLTTPFNGNFEDTNQQSPFTWKLGSGPGAISQITVDPVQPKNRILMVSFGQGRVTFPGVSQLQLLPPGQYRLDARFKADLQGPRGLIWRVSCMDPNRSRLGQTEMHLGRKPEWTSTGFQFKVQGEPCMAQLLELVLDARSASEQLVTGWVAYDDVQITRLTDKE